MNFLNDAVLFFITNFVLILPSYTSTAAPIIGAVYFCLEIRLIYMQYESLQVLGQSTRYYN